MTCWLVFLPYWCINTIIHRRYSIIFNGKWQINFIVVENKLEEGFVSLIFVAVSRDFFFCRWFSLEWKYLSPFKSQIRHGKGDVRIPLTTKSFSCSFLQKTTTWSRQLLCGILFTLQTRFIDFFVFRKTRKCQMPSHRIFNWLAAVCWQPRSGFFFFSRGLPLSKEKGIWLRNPAVWSRWMSKYGTSARPTKRGHRQRK